MAKTLIQHYTDFNTVTFNVTRYMSAFAAGDLWSATAEQTSYVWRTAGTFSNLYVKVSAFTHNAAIDVRTYKNAGNGNQSYSINATGEFLNTSGTDTITDGDKFSYQVVTTASTSGSVTFRAVSVLFDPDAGGSLVRYGPGANQSIASGSTYYLPIPEGRGAAPTTTESNAEVEIKEACTLQKLLVRIGSGGGSSTSTIKSRKNGADGNLAVSTSGNGVFEDTTHSDSLAAGDRTCLSLTVNTGGPISYDAFDSDIVTTTAKSVCANGYRGGIAIGSADTFFPIMGSMENSTTETNLRADVRVACTFSNLWFMVIANARSTTTNFLLRKNGVSTALTAGFAGGATGEFQNISDTVTFVATDEANLMHDQGTGSGGTTYGCTQLVMENTTPVGGRRIFIV